LERKVPAVAALFLGKGDGTFATPVQLPLSGFLQAVGDFNADGVADLAAGNGMGVTLIGLGNGNGQFSVITLQGAYPRAAGDFNGDGALDLATSGVASQNYSYAVQVQGSYQDFALGQSISNLAISSGQNASLTLYVSPVGSFAQSVSFSCAGISSGKPGSSFLFRCVASVRSATAVASRGLPNIVCEW
jgi:hypothetical protein